MEINKLWRIAPKFNSALRLNSINKIIYWTLLSGVAELDVFMAQLFVIHSRACSKQQKLMRLGTALSEKSSKLILYVIQHIIL